MAKFDDLVDCIQSIAVPNDFSGFGLVVYSGQPDGLPISPLSTGVIPRTSGKVADTVVCLFELSRMTDPRHDGFHFLNEHLELTHISQYFAPPVDRHGETLVMNVGSRFRTAQLGSVIDGVRSVIVMDRNRGLYIFENGIIEKIS